jgi:hypothetical protein
MMVKAAVGRGRREKEGGRREEEARKHALLIKLQT